VRAELDAVLGHLSHLREAEHLVAAAVGENRVRPPDEAVQPARARDHIVARTQVQVVRVAENDLRAGVLEIAMRDRLDGAARAHGHEHRRLDDAVRRVQDAAARLPLCVCDFEPHRRPASLFSPESCILNS
jgi:hypothetical protein